MARTRVAIPKLVLFIMGICESLLRVWRTPWRLVNPMDHSIAVRVRAPLWSRPVSPSGRFEIDAPRLAVWLIGVWASIGLLFLLTSERR